MKKSQCILIDPPTWRNGRIFAGKRKQISRVEAAQYLKACRLCKAALLRLRPGQYAILPHGIEHGFKLLTK